MLDGRQFGLTAMWGSLFESLSIIIWTLKLSTFVFSLGNGTYTIERHDTNLSTL